MHTHIATTSRSVSRGSGLDKHNASGRSGWLLLLVLAGLAVGGVAGMLSLMSNDGDPQPRAADGTLPQSAPASRAASVNDLLGPLAQRLAQQPDDPSGWALLGKSYDHMGRHNEAADAYRQAIDRGHTDPALVDALRAAEDALLETAFGGSSGSGLANSNKPVASSVAIHGQVSVAEHLLASVEPQDTVFVYATARDGSRMPIAVIRSPASALPSAFTLDDSAAMLAGRSLADSDELLVTARISRSGNALTQPGDLIAQSVTFVSSSMEPIDLIIDRVVSNDE